MGLAEEIAAQRAQVDGLGAALWRHGFDEAALARYQAAFRRLEDLLARQGGRRHDFIVVIPAADNPRQLANCLDSLLGQCEAYGYGGREQGRWRRVSVLLADDSTDAANIVSHRQIAADVERRGIAVDYFGLEEQLGLVGRLQGLGLEGVIGNHPRDDYGHKGQAMMRNIAYLRLAELQAQRPGQSLLFHTVDADQEFRVLVPTADGGRRVAAVNYFYWLDRLFGQTPLQILTGKVVGDPPVSPAVMAGNFLDDAIAFLREMAAADPGAPYRQPLVEHGGGGEAAYHDMADMFGFAPAAGAYRYRCGLDGGASNAECLDDFTRHLNGFLHGEHPTRITWYHPGPVEASVQPARTVYTGNYVFRPQVLGWFIPFAPLRLRMSGPTMGRMLRAELGEAFVSANVPMLHRRTLSAGGPSEYRPGVVAAADAVDLADEFERQFFGDVMLFSMERLTAAGYPGARLGRGCIGATLDTVYAEMGGRYHVRQQAVLERLGELRRRLHDPAAWWHRSPALAGALIAFDRFIGNIERNFGPDSAASTRIVSDEVWQAWRRRELEAIAGLHGDREAWALALARLAGSATR